MSDDRVGKKIKILRDEGTPQRQAVAEALSMNRANRLGPNGEYYRVGRKSKSRTTSRR